MASSQEDLNIWQSMDQIIRKIIDNCGPRAPCSPNEKQAADLLHQELDTFADKTTDESFTCHPRSFDGWANLSAWLCLLSIGIFDLTYLGLPMLLSSIGAILVIILLFYCIWRQFFNYEEFTHRIFPYAYKIGNSQNVIGTFSPRDQVSHRVIFAGHYDSAFRFNLIDKTDVGYAFFLFGGFALLFTSVVIFIIGFIISCFSIDLTILLKILSFWLISNVGIYIIILLIGGKNPKFLYGILNKPSKKTIGIITGIFLYNTLIGIFGMIWMGNTPTVLSLLLIFTIQSIPFAIAFILFMGQKAVPGVMDNLSAVAICYQIAKTLALWRSNNDDRFPKNTEVIILFPGCEEAGDRGSEDFAKRHAEEFNQIDTTVVNLESITDPDIQKIITKEVTTRTLCDPEIYNLLSKVADQLEVPHQFTEIPGMAGGTDCEGFYKGGLRVSGLEGIRYSEYLHWYHTDHDDLTQIEGDLGQRHSKAMLNAYHICIGYLLAKDSSNK